MENKKNFWCKIGLHFWVNYMPMINKLGLITYDTNNDWRKCKKCNRRQINEGLGWEDK